MSDLKPCPFCGGKGDPGHHKSSYKDDEHYLVMCMKCFARTVGETLEEAIDAWNHRKPFINCEAAEHNSHGCSGYGYSDGRPAQQCNDCKKYTGLREGD